MAESIRESDGGIPSLNVCGNRAEERKAMSNSVTSLGVTRESGGVMMEMYFRRAGAHTPCNCNFASVTVPSLLAT